MRKTLVSIIGKPDNDDFMMKNLTNFNRKDFLIVVGIVVAILIGLSTQWAMAKNPLLDMIMI
jgi:hypothetical protein